MQTFGEWFAIQPCSCVMNRHMKEHLAEAWNAAAAEYREALEQIVAAGPPPEPPKWDGDCCYGNYDDAHLHGIALGRRRAAELALAALAAARGESTEGGG